MTRQVTCSLAISGLGWLAINEFARLRELPYCRGLKDYRQHKTFFRSYAEGKLVFDVPDYYYDTFCDIYLNCPSYGAPCLYERLPRHIPTEMEFRLTKLMQDKREFKALKEWYLRKASKSSTPSDGTIVGTVHGDFPYAFLNERVFKKIGWFERFFFWFRNLP